MFKIQSLSGMAFEGVPFDKIPLTISEWQGSNFETSQEVLEILGTKDVLSRQYKNREGQKINFSIIYSGNNRDSFHPPEYCFIGGGATLVGKSKESILLDESSNLSVNKLKMEDKYGKLTSWYWFSIDDKFVSNYYLQQVYILLDALRGKKFRGALIKVSIRGKDLNLEIKAREFIRQMVPQLKNIL